MPLIHLDSQSFHGRKYNLSPRLEAAGRRLIGLPGMQRFKPMASKAASITQNHSQYSIKFNPDQARSGQPDSITVLSANLCHDWPRFRRLSDRLKIFSHFVEQEEVDILLLQEVANLRGMHVADWLASRLGMACVYTRANGHFSIGFEEGLAIVSRYPLSDPQIHRLGKAWNPFVHRLLLAAQVQTPFGDIPVYSAHLGILPYDNSGQQQDLSRIIQNNSHRGPAIIGGDFNRDEARIQLNRTHWVDTFRSKNPSSVAHTHALRWPWGAIYRKKRLDYIFIYRPDARWEILESRHLSNPLFRHSDHDAVLTRLAIRNGGPITISGN